MEQKVYPENGGCWFCYTVGDWNDMRFDSEFDTNVHLSCVKDNLGKENEAEIMSYLLRSGERSNPPEVMYGVDFGIRTRSGKDPMRIKSSNNLIMHELLEDYEGNPGISIHDDLYNVYIRFKVESKKITPYVQKINSKHLEVVLDSESGKHTDLRCIVRGPLAGYFVISQDFGLELIPLRVNDYVTLGSFLEEVGFGTKYVMYNFNGCVFKLQQKGEEWEIIQEGA